MLCWNTDTISLGACVVATTRFSISNASSHLLRNRFFSRYKYKKQEYSQFFTFISTVKYLVSFTRDYYKTVLNVEEGIPFICVSHDGWDSKDNNVLGVCIHFIVPHHWKMVSLAIGLRRVYSKTAEHLVNAIKNILLR